MRKPTLVAAVVSLLACSPEDLAALNRATTAQVNELNHDVVVRFEDGAARLTVTRRLRNDTARYQSLRKRLEVPEGAIATALRVGTDGRWAAPATLAGNEEAAARWDLLSRPGEAAPATLGLLEWGLGGGLDLQLFALAPGATVDVEYDLELSAEYAAGELDFVYPREEPEAGWLAPRFELGPATLTEVVAPESTEATAYQVRRRDDPRDELAARWGTYPIDTGRTLWRLEVDARAELGKAPVQPNVVFVIDGSHSQGTEGIAAQLELIAPYLANARDAQVEVVIYRRFAERLLGRFVSASQVPALLASLSPEQLAPGNGSHLELGAGLAAELLARVGGPGRVVLFTDEALRFGFTNALALDALRAAPTGTVLHVVARSAPGSGELTETRDDDAPLSPIAAAHGGILLRVGGHANDPVRSADTLLGLVRPVRIDSFTVETLGDWEVEARLDQRRTRLAAQTADDAFEPLPVDSELREGGSVRVTALAENPPSEVVLSGKVWARDFKRVVPTDPALSNRLPGIAVGDDSVRYELSDDELRTAAFLSHAVSPVTSYLAAPPDAAPSTAGVEELGLRGIGHHASTCGGFSSRTSCGWGFARVGADLVAVLRALLEAGVSACERQHGELGAASLNLEATGDEVVDVTVASASPALGECLVEAAWALRLGPEFARHRTYAVPLRP